MKTWLTLLLVIVSTAVCYPTTAVSDELTGIYHKAVKMDPAYLEIDGPGFVTRIEVDGQSIKDAPDGKRLWLSGDIKTWLSGNPEKPHDEEQQQLTQWKIVMVVTEWKPISKAFERPEKKDSQNKAPEATR